MAKEKEPTKVEVEEFDIDNFRQQAMGTFEKYKNVVYGVLLGIIVVIGGLYVYFYMYSGPREKNAKEAIFQAEYYFGIDSFELALKGREAIGQIEGSFMGFLDVISQYGGTSSANLAQYYAGACLVNIGKFDEALPYLEAYNGKDKLTQSNAYGLIGDCKSEAGDMDAAEKYYVKATTTYPNEMTTPVHMKKLALFYSDVKNDNAKALEILERMKKEYPDAAMKQLVDRDIVRLGGK